jgi:DNA-binding MurR/RpiR family transcriptional regulator
MPHATSISARIEAAWPTAGPAERKVLAYFRDYREEVLIASAADMAAKIATSDATVIRTVRAIGFPGLDPFRRAIADELRASQTPAARMQRTLTVVGQDIASSLRQTIDVHIAALEAVRADTRVEHFASVVDTLLAARRVVVFGIGPSGCLAEYFGLQVRRFGLDAIALTHTGLLFADDVKRLRAGDAVLMLAYSRVYDELAVLLERCEQLELPRVLVSDTLVEELRGRMTETLTVARGQSDMLSLHAATLGLLECILVGIAVRRPTGTLDSLTELNRLRSETTGRSMDLPMERPSRIRRRRKP